MMNDHKHILHSPNIQLRRYLPILIVTGLAVHLLLPQIVTLEKSWSVIKGMAWWGALLAVAAQTLSYAGSGYMLQAILRSNNERLSVLRGALITLASNSIGLVAGGWVGGAAATYVWIRSENRDGSTAVLAGTLPALLNNAVLVTAALIGTIYLMLVHDLSQTQLIEFAIILVGLGLIAGAVVVALHSPDQATHIATLAAGKWAALRRKPFDPQDIVQAIDGFIQAWQHLQKGNWREPLLGAVANVGFDMLTLYSMFLAAGEKVSLGVLFAGYGLPFILGKMAFIIPGGVGVIEGSMVALYTSLKIPNQVSVVVILGYRLLSFWIPTLLGFAAVVVLRRKTSEG